MVNQTAFIFDLDGTLIDNVYVHILAWQHAFAQGGFQVPAYEIHRRIGMSGEVFTRALLRGQVSPVSEDIVRHLGTLHQNKYKELSFLVKPLPGAIDLLAHLTASRTPFALATTAEAETAQPDLHRLRLDSDQNVVITRKDAPNGKPNPDIFSMAAKRLHVPIHSTIVVGDSVWDMLACRRAGGFCVGVLSGGYAKEELENAGANRVFADPADLLAHLEEVGGPPAWGPKGNP
jgi:HAD superfamily hydrolase (TIGR01509 family)